MFTQMSSIGNRKFLKIRERCFVIADETMGNDQIPKSGFDTRHN